MLETHRRTSDRHNHEETTMSGRNSQTITLPSGTKFRTAANPAKTRYAAVVEAVTVDPEKMTRTTSARIERRSADLDVVLAHVRRKGERFVHRGESGVRMVVDLTNGQVLR